MYTEKVNIYFETIHTMLTFRKRCATLNSIGATSFEMSTT